LTAEIEINDLTFHYPDGRLALDHVCLEASAGEKVALIGPNGAGKSTLLLHLNGILQGAGRVRVQGIEVTPHSLGQVRALVGLVFQNPDDQLFSASVFDDVAYGPLYQGLPDDEVRQRVEHALAAVQMDDYVQRLPYHLSMGEKKRIAVATVLSMEPVVLALDEPTAGLDPRAGRELGELLSVMRQTMLIATHDLDLVRRLADRVVVMENGRIIKDSAPESVLGDEDFLLAHGLA
jgi:cobalt/nickel transport system ATP-binding protein